MGNTARSVTRARETSMKQNLKAALLSALVLPGLGQLYLGRKVKGVCIITLVNIFLLIALAYVLKGFGRIFRSTGTVQAVDASKIVADLQQEAPVVRWLLFLFLVIWAYGIIDALRVHPNDAGKAPN